MSSGPAVATSKTVTSAPLLPDTLDEASLRALLDQAIQAIANEIWCIYDEGLKDTHGEDWSRVLSPRAGQKIGFGDLSTLVSVLLEAPAERRDHFRRALGAQRFRRLDHAGALRDLRDVRNSFSHSDASTTGDVEWVEEALARLMGAAQHAELGCLPLLQRLSAHLTRLQSPHARLDLAQAQKDVRAANMASDAAIRSEDRANAARERAEDDKVRAEQALQSANTRIASLEAQLAATASENRHLASAQRHAAESKRSLAQEQAKRRRAEEALAAATAETESAQTSLEEQILLREAAERRQRDAENAQLRQQALAAQSAGSAQRPGGAAESPRRTRRKRPHTGASSSSQSQASIPDRNDEDATTPGQAWRSIRVREVWRLSAASRALTRCEDDADLAELVGMREASRVVDAFLGIRPTGGRVWVDEDGHATTYVDGRLRYLGSIPQRRKGRDSRTEQRARHRQQSVRVVPVPRQATTASPSTGGGARDDQPRSCVRCKKPTWSSAPSAKYCADHRREAEIMWARGPAAYREWVQEHPSNAAPSASAAHAATAPVNTCVRCDRPTLSSSPSAKYCAEHRREAEAMWAKGPAAYRAWKEQ